MPSWKPVFYIASSLLVVFECSAIALPPPQLRGSRLAKRVPATFDASCDGFPDIATGWNEALNMATVAAGLLQNEDPFSDFDTFGPVRRALFGDQTLSPTQDIINIYNQISAGPAATIFCGEPPKAVADGASRCVGIGLDGNSATLDAYRLFVEPGDSQESIDDRSLGFQDGQNIVVCPDTLPGKSRGFQLLATQTPAAGRDIECFKFSYGSMFVHEISHIFGTLDFPPYGYGFNAATRIATDAATGNAQTTIDPATGNAVSATPLRNADTFGFFALAVSQVSTPRMDAFEWSTGFGVTIA